MIGKMYQRNIHNRTEDVVTTVELSEAMAIFEAEYEQDLAELSLDDVDTPDASPQPTEHTQAVPITIPTKPRL